jgi:hypothetical protein
MGFQMTSKELLEALQNGYVDQNGLVKSNVGQEDSDNGVLSASVAQILTGTQCFQDAIDKCYIEPGLLGRKPKGLEQAQEQFDDYLGRAIACMLTGNTTEPREILRYGLLNGFVFNTDKKLEWKDFLGRFPIVFMFMFAAAFPKLKYLVYPLLTLYCYSLTPPDLSDCSGLQLQLLMLVGYNKLYRNEIGFDWSLKFEKKNKARIYEIFLGYYKTDHPFTKFIAFRDIFYFLLCF